MIFKESRLKAEQIVATNLNGDTNQNAGTNNYRQLLGLSYNSSYNSLIPTRFKWGRSMIRVVD